MTVQRCQAASAAQAKSRASALGLPALPAGPAARARVSVARLPLGGAKEAASGKVPRMTAGKLSAHESLVLRVGASARGGRRARAAPPRPPPLTANALLPSCSRGQDHALGIAHPQPLRMGPPGQLRREPQEVRR